MVPIFANVIQDAFSPLISVFKAIMVFLHDNATGGSWGLAIIGLTIVVRAALVPLTVKQFSSMAKLQVLGPEIKALQARHKEDKQRLNEEMMKFYKENQVNPFGSCLPLVLQFPVFISLFYMLRTDLKLQICGHALRTHEITAASAIQKASCQSVAPGSGKFLFIPDITDSAHGSVLIVLIVLYIGSQLISSLMTTATVDRNQRMIALGLPFLFTFFIISFPAGLIVYWITTNLWTVGQQYIVRRYFPPAHLANAPADAGKLSLPRLWPWGGDGGRGAEGSGEAPVGGGGAGRANGTKGAAKVAGTRGAAKVAGTRGGAKATGSRGAAKATGTSGAAKATGSRGAAKANGTEGASATKTAATGGASKKGVPASRADRKGSAGAAPTKQAPTKAPPGAGRGKGRAAPQSSNGQGGAQDATSDEGAGRSPKPAATPRARGAAPPPPPRKKKKRSGRRR